MNESYDSEIVGLIGEMEDYIAGCRPKMMSQTDIIVNRATIDEFLRRLRLKVPDEVEYCRKIIRKQEAILNDAKTKAQNLIDQAMVETDQLLNQNEIMKRAYEESDGVVLMAQQQAQAIVDQAVMESNAVRSAAAQYMEDMMIYLEDVLASATQSATSQYTSLIETLGQYEAKVRDDHKQLHPEIKEEAGNTDTDNAAGNTQ